MESGEQVAHKCEKLRSVLSSLAATAIMTVMTLAVMEVALRLVGHLQDRRIPFATFDCAAVYPGAGIGGRCA